MKMWLKLLYYDLKEMGIVFLVPIIVAFGVASYGMFIYCGAPIGQESSAAVTVMNLLQNFIPPVSSWWIIMAFHRYAEEEGTEAFFTYGISKKKTGIGRTLIFVAVMIMLIFIIMIPIHLMGILRIETAVIVFLVLSVQSLLYGSCGFLFILWFRNTIWSITAILIIASLNIWGNIPVISRYLSITVRMQAQMSLSGLCLYFLFIIGISVVINYKGQKLFFELGTRKYG